jgi:hypothetical protein
MTTELLEERGGILDLELPMTRLIEHVAIIGNGAHAFREPSMTPELAEGVSRPISTASGVLCTAVLAGPPPFRCAGDRT